ncbi:FAD-binding protein [Actinocorallia sp. B10E7]|uniref:FAD-binding oxidoreductase n=1 Tax=Actinocorallia sp. B10E7 TaxID=3153558 RepID=UPI00325E1D54
MNEQNGASVEDLRNILKGQVLLPGEPGFEAAAASWDLSVRQEVRAVAEIADAHDAAAVVAHARRAGLGVAAQASGHGATTALNGTILVRTGAMRGIEIDADRSVARIEAGARWGEIQAQAARHGLTGLCGSAPVVSATGYLLGGGLSWFGRKHGLAAGSVRAAEIVDAEGVLRRVTQADDPELLWALRGGGGDFALVTALEIDLYPASELYGGRVIWPAARASEVMAAFRRLTADAPDELTAWFTLLNPPPSPDVPEALRGPLATIDVTYLGDPDKGRELTRILDSVPGVLSDGRGPLSPAEVGGICAEPENPTPILYRSELFGEFTEEAAGKLLDAAGHEGIAPLAMLQVRHLGGALARPVDGACGAMAEPYLLGMLGVTFAPELEEAVRARQEEIATALEPHLSGRKPFTFLRSDGAAADAFPAETLARLRDVKRRRDPNGVFRSNFPVSD